VLSAGHDLNLTTVTDLATQTASWKEGKQHITQTTTDETLHGVTVNAGTGLALVAGHDATLTAATLATQSGAAIVQAGHDVNLLSGLETHTVETDTKKKSSGLFSSKTTTTHDFVSDTQALGTTLSGDTVKVAAGNDLMAQAAQLTANGALSLTAGHDVNLTTAEGEHSEDSWKTVKKSSFFSSDPLRFGSVDPQSSGRKDSHSSDQTWSVGSTLSGDTVTVGAGHDLTATAAQVAGTHDVTLAAGNNLTLGAGENTYASTDGTGKSRTGLQHGNGLNLLIGNTTTQTTNQVDDLSYTGSLVGSTNGAVTLSAGKDVHITASDVLSQTGTTVVGQNVTVDAALGTTDITQKQTMHSGGIHVGLSGAIVSAAEAAYGSTQRGSEVKDDRLKALYAIQAAQAVSSGVQAAQAAQSQDGSGINLQVGLTASTARSVSKTHDDVTYGSHLQSQGDVTVAATQGNLNVVGSEIHGQNVALSASQDLNLLSQTEQHTLESTNSNASGGIGVSFGSNGFNIYVQASMGKGKAHGNGETHTDTTVTAADTLSLAAGHDATIQGAQAKGNTVLADVGHNLNLASEQDTNDYASKQWQAGGTVMFGAGGGGSFSYSQSKVNSNYASVTQVSGIAAGEGGFDAHVGGNTDLKGAVIASTADPALNYLSTGSLTSSDIQNEAKGGASGMGYTVDSSMLSGSKYAAAKGIVSNALGSGSDSKQRDSATHSDVASGFVDVRDGNAGALDGLSRQATDLSGGSTLKQVDLEKLQENVEAQQLAKKIVYQEAVKFTDNAYRTMFLEKANVYEVVKDKEGNLVKGRLLSDEEKMNMQPASDGKVHIADNGIFNDAAASEKYADQHSSAADGPQYYIAFPKADNGWIVRAACRRLPKVSGG
jgi:filamentous hemagglutinin